MSRIYSILLQCAAIAAALIGGIFYAFSSFIMDALVRLSGPDGMAAMNEINRTVYTPSFTWLFFGTAILCAGLALWSVRTIKSLDSQLILLAGVLFLVGVVVVTAIFNVPLNNQLAAASGERAASLWPAFASDWTIWNTVRTVCAGLAASLYIWVVARN
ncbi:anthrone oxygenase family protein [Sphingopyxis sp.]|jgi:uncharacterized membrane protein|uniref:anthrone oxygenase family protein n=1 Tax=Sphingopyxis sp. TaxID=1908224 RepID=UPI003F71AE4B